MGGHLSYHVENGHLWFAINSGSVTYAHDIDFPPGQKFEVFFWVELEKIWTRAGKIPFSLIVCHSGPEAFTILRTTLSALQGIGLAFKDIQACTPSFFELVAYAARETFSCQKLILLNTHAQGFYGQVYHDLLPQDEPRFWSALEIESFLYQNPNAACLSRSFIAEEVPTQWPCVSWGEVLLDYARDHSQQWKPLQEVSPIYFLTRAYS